MNPRWTPIHRIKTLPNPGAGVELTLRADTSSWMLVKSVRLIFTADANVATRRITLSASDGNMEYLRLNAAGVQTATQAFTYCAYPGSSNGVAGATVVSIDWPTDNVWIPPGGSLSSICSNLQAGDAYSGIAFSIIEIPYGPETFLFPFTPYFAKESS